MIQEGSNYTWARLDPMAAVTGKQDLGAAREVQTTFDPFTECSENCNPNLTHL